MGSKGDVEPLLSKKVSKAGHSDDMGLLGGLL